MDIFNPLNREGLTSKIIGSRILSVKEFLPPCNKPESYFEIDFNIRSRDEIKGIVDIVSEPTIYRLKDHRFNISIHEAIQNAYQHGNNSNPNKIIRVSYNDQGSFVVQDEGGIIPSELLLFVLALRENEPTNTFYNAFPHVTKPYPTNQGLGTLFMHRYCDVSYNSGELGGLAVRLDLKR